MKDFLEILESYALVRLLLTQEPHIAELTHLELEGGSEAEALEAEALDRAEEDLRSLLDELVSLLPGRNRRAALELLDRVLERGEHYWIETGHGYSGRYGLPDA